jgi:hypothetical protein|tara:strand:+ start:236 stop:835 length:600 start_codon:yes stop_codon:yes gene_type:complete
MDFWIKVGILSLTLSGCESIDKNLSTKNLNIEITDEIKFSPYAMQTISIDDEKEYLFYLNSVNGSLHKWSDTNGIKVIIDNGKVIKTYGLNNDFDIKYYQGFIDMEPSQAYIRFLNPESGYMQIFFSYDIIKEGSMEKIIDNSLFNYTLIKESFEVPLIKWSGTNYYWVDIENDVWLTKQIIDPYDKKIRIKVLKKYSD